LIKHITKTQIHTILPPQGLQTGRAAALAAKFTSQVLDTIVAQNFTKIFSLKEKKIKSLKPYLFHAKYFFNITLKK